MDLAEIKRNNFRTYLTRGYGIEFNEQGYAICPFHPNENKASFQVSLHKGVWRFTDWHLGPDEKGFSGTIVDFVMKKEGISLEEAISKLKSEFLHQKMDDYEKKLNNERTKQQLTPGRLSEYVYQDATGKEVFKKVKVERENGEKKYWIEKKVKGRWKQNKGNFRHLPYNLHKFQNFAKLIICEGEKDSDAVNHLGTNFLATSAPTGAHNWDDSLTPYFEGKSKLVFLYDVGNEGYVLAHAAKLSAAFPNMKILIGKVPLDFREADISDYLNQFPDRKKKIKALLKIIKEADMFVPQRTLRALIEPIPELIPNLDINNRFLNNWMASLSRITDAPKIFLLFAGLALLSAVLNKFYFRYPRRIQLNLYILLLAPSTYYRKSTCTDLVSDYLYEVNPELKLPDSFTVEALFEILGEHSRGMIIWPELIQVKEFQMARDYNKGLPAFLTDIYDYKKNLKRWTVKSGEKIVEEPIVSILAAGIVDWFTKNLQAIDFYGGIWTRFMLVPAPEQERRFSLPKAFELDQTLVNQLTQLDEMPVGELDLEEIKPHIQEWGERHQRETMGLGTGIISAMYQRLEVMLLKIAAILQLSHDHSLTITPETFREAKKIVDYMKTYLPSFFTDEIHFGEHEKARATILKFIQKKGRVQKKEVLQGTKIPKKLADPALRQLIDEEEIKEIEIPSPKRGGRPGHEYEYVRTDTRQR